MKRKRETIPKDTRYVPVVQQRYCCVPACIQMIMLKHNISLISQEVMAYHMHVIVPKKDAKLFWNVRSTGKKIKGGYGTQLNEDKTAGPMFTKLKIPLEIKWRLIDTFSDFAEFKKYMKMCVAKKRDVIICYKWGTLHNSDFDGGHVSVLDQVYPRKEEVRFIDPGAKAPKWCTVKMRKLYKAMQTHGKENMGGFWEVKKTR